MTAERAAGGRVPTSDPAPTLTVVAALFRPGPLLDGFLERVDALRSDGVELVLVDDGSGDGTAAALRAWARDRASVVVIENTTNLGVARSRNRAVAAARGTWVWFVDHDDRWHPDAARRMTAAAGSDPELDVVVCRADYRTHPDRPGRVVDGLPVPRVRTGPEALLMLLEGTIDGFLWSKLVRRSVLGSAPFPSLPSQSDVAGLAAVLARARGVRFVPDVLYHWVHRPGSVSRARVPSLDALEAAHTAVADAAVTLPALADPVRRDDLLTTRQRAPWTVRREGLRRARAALRGRRLGGVRRRSVPLWLLMVAIRACPSVVLLGLPPLFAVHDRRGWRRRARG
jgi:hypothetical protein